MRYIKIILIIAMTTLLVACGSSSDNTAVSQPAEEESSENVDQSTLLRVACVGDSNTAGIGLSNPARDSYPSQLSVMLGEGWEVQNFGIKSATLMKSGSLPYWSTNMFNPSHDYHPDIVVIMLGTNDAKTSNWVRKNQFVPDYTALIESYENLPSQPTVFVSYPPPVYSEVAGITDQRIKEEVIPKISQVSSINGVAVIDVYSALSNKKELFSDKVHLNIEGARQLAQTVYQSIY